jgi:hypothetical protein
MKKHFSEMVIEGPFILVKGFLMGFLYGSDRQFQYFFHRKHGIRRETFREFIKELFEFENYVHLCLENSIVQNFSDAIKKSNEKIGLKIKSVRKIKSANFSFSYEIFNQELAAEAKKLFENLPAGLELSDFNTNEEIADDAVGPEGYAPVHSFISRSSGKAKGDFLDIMELFLRIKKSKLSESVICSRIHLDLENQT